MAQWKRRGERYVDIQSGVSISKHQYRENRAGRTEIFTQSRTIHRSVPTLIGATEGDWFHEDVRRNRGKAYAVFARWVSPKTGKTYQTPAVLVRGRSAQQIGDDLFNKGTGKEKWKGSRLPERVEDEDYEPEELSIELVFITKV